MTIDPLYILLMVEAIIILAAIVIFMARRPRGNIPEAHPPEPPADPLPDSDMLRPSLFLRMLEDNIKEIEKNPGLGQGDQNPESQGLLLDQVYNLNLDLLKNLAEALRQEEATPVECLTEALTVKFRVSVNERLLSFMRSLVEQAAPEPERGSEDP